MPSGRRSRRKVSRVRRIASLEPKCPDISSPGNVESARQIAVKLQENISIDYEIVVGLLSDQIFHLAEVVVPTDLWT